MVEKVSGGSGLIMALRMKAPQREAILVVMVFHDGPEEEGNAIFKPLLDLDAITVDVRERPYEEMDTVFNAGNGRGLRRCSKEASYVTPIRPEFAQSILSNLKALRERVPTSIDTKLGFEFHKPDQWCRVSKRAMAFANRGNHQNVMIGPKWEKESDGLACRYWMADVAQKFSGELQRIRAEAEAPKALREIKEYDNRDGESPPRKPWRTLLRIKSEVHKSLC